MDGLWDNGTLGEDMQKSPLPVSVSACVASDLHWFVHTGDEGARFTKICNVQTQIISSAVDFETIH